MYKTARAFVINYQSRLFLGESKSNMMFHQDGASVHTSRWIMQFLDEDGIKYATQEEWMPKSHDAARKDYSTCGILKRDLHQKYTRTLVCSGVPLK